MDATNGFGTNDILTGRGLGLGGFGGYNYGQGSFSGPTANAIRIESGNRAAATGLENLLDQNQFTTTNKNVTDCCNRATDQATNSEFRTGDRLRDLEREINQNARIAADCCCAIKLQSCEDKAQILAAIATQTATTLAAESRGVERDRNTIQAELISLKTQVACNCNCPSAS